MTYKQFSDILHTLQEQDKVVDELYKNKVDLYDFIDAYHKVITMLIKEVYGEEGYDSWSWYVYENDYGTKGLEAWDKDGKRICYSHESLWEYLESLTKRFCRKNSI